MNMSKQCLYPRDQRLTIEELADRYRHIKRARIALTPRPRTQVGIEICGRGNAAGEISPPRFEQGCLGRWKHCKIPGDSRRGAGVSHVAR